MGMNPNRFFSVFVEKNFEDFDNDPGNVRKGLNSAISTFHMADHYYNYYEKNNPSKIDSYGNRTNFLKHLSNKSKYFNDIQSIANAYKHLYTDSNESHVTVSSTGTIEFIEFDQDNVKVDGCEEDDNGNIIVIYTTKNSQKVKLLVALKDVIDMWNKILNN